MNDSITADIFAALNILVLEQLNTGLFRITGNIPDWLKRFCPDAISEMEIVIPAENFPFLANFLIDAEEFWQGNGQTRLESGLWSEIDLEGNECNFEASAIFINNRKIVLIELLKTAYEEKQSLIQKARENNLSFQQLLKESQKKEILLHCIMHDLAGQLTGINCCFALLEFEDLTPKGRERLQIGRKQSLKQEMLIRDLLNAFSADLESLEAFTANPAHAPDALTCGQEVVQALLPSFSLNNISLQLAANLDATADWKVVGEKSRLERVITNLVENALRYSPPESTVTLGLQDDGQYILITVDDQGSGVQPEVSQTLFQKFSQGKGKSGRAGLGLYFCRITVERWGGTIGYSLRPEGGSRFWFRLPRPRSY